MATKTGSSSVETATSLRATDEDRERIARALDDAHERGALDSAELGKRKSQVQAALETRELSALTADLPGPTGAEIERTQRDADLGEWLQEWRWWLGGAIILSSIWGIQAIRSGPDFFWPLVPLGIWAAVLVAVAIWPRDDSL